MSGILGIASPWAKQELRAAEREAFTARIPDGYVIGVGSSANRVWRVWVLSEQERATLRQWDTVHDLRGGIDAAIAWIETHDTATYDGMEVPVR